VSWDEDTDSEGDDEDGLVAYAAQIGQRRPGSRSRTNWTTVMDEQLLETVAEVGTGNWPRVLIVAHSYHKLTNVTVRCVGASLSPLLTLYLPGVCRASPPLRAAALAQELA